MVRPENKTSFYDRYNGMAVYVANTTNKDVEFSAQDGRLYM